MAAESGSHVVGSVTFGSPAYAPVQGCEGCRTTAGALGCPLHSPRNVTPTEPGVTLQCAMDDRMIVAHALEAWRGGYPADQARAKELARKVREEGGLAV